MKISHKSNFSVAFSYVSQSFMSAHNFLELYIAVLKNWTGILRFLLIKLNSQVTTFSVSCSKQLQAMPSFIVCKGLL